MKNWFSRINIWISQLAETKWGLFALFVSAFADASFLPLPVTTLFLILILLNTRMILKSIFFVVLGTLAGAVAGYLTGHFAWLKSDGGFTGVVQFLFDNIPGFSANVYEKVHFMFTKWDFWILCIATVTPLPYGMFSVTSGVFDINIFIFLFTTFVCQTLKFSFLSLAAMKLGAQADKFLKLNWKPLAILVAFILIGFAISNNL